MTHLIESNKLEMNLMLLHCLTIFNYRYEQCDRSIQHTDRPAFDILQLQQVIFNYLI
jgi:hypothetical protein